MAAKWTRFWARAFPGTNALRRDKSYQDQDYYLELTVDEAKALNMRGMPLSLQHVNGVKTTEGVGATPMKVEYPKNKDVLGRVVDQMTLDDGTIMVQCEIGVGTPGETLPERALKEAAVALLRNGHYSVSLLHGFDQRYEADTDQNVVRKYPVELSLTMDPRRADADVLHVYEADGPYSREENKYDVYRAGCESRINYAAVDRKDIANEMTTQTNDAAAGTGPRKFSESEIAQLIKDRDEMKAQLDRFKPLADEYMQKRKDEENALRQKAIKNVTDLHENAQNLMKQLLDSGISIPEPDRKAFQDMVTVAEKDKPQAEAAINSIISNEVREKGAPPTALDLWKNLDSVLSQSVMPSIVACARVNHFLQQHVQANASTVAATTRAAAKPGAPVTAAVQKQPEPIWNINWDQVTQRNAARMKEYEITGDTN